jgi:hypothetical protein
MLLRRLASSAHSINAEARVLGDWMTAGETIVQPIANGQAHLVLTRGRISVNGSSPSP